MIVYLRIQVSVVVERHFGDIGLVQVNYQTSPGTAQSNGMSNPDYISASDWIRFDDGQIKKVITIALIDDNDPEGPEYFYVNITGTELIMPRYELGFC